MCAATAERVEVEPVTEETLEFPPVRVDKKFVITQQGKDYVTYPGLVDALHQLSLGFFSVDTRIEQLPTGENGQQAVCSACVRVYDPDNPDVIRRSVTGLGDASPANVSRMMANALIRMAETRAKARALRDLLNVGMVAYEELGPQSAEEPGAPVGERSAARPAPPTDRIAVGDRVFSREEVISTKRARVEACQEAGVALPVPVPPDGAPLSEQVGFSQRLRELLLQRRAHAK
jgi:hypothetical protein